MFEIKKRDDAGRIGILKIRERAFTTPDLIFFKSERFPVGNGIESTHPFIELKEGRPFFEGEFMDGIAGVFKGELTSGDPSERAVSLVNLREIAGFSRALYLPGTGAVFDYALLAYAGVDLFDASPLILYARKGYYLTEYGPVAEEDWEDERCHCPACLSKKQGFETRWRHNYLAALRELATVREFIRMGRLRHLVEIRVRANPELLSVLRHLDREHFSFFEKRLSFVGGGVVGISEDTLHSPEVRHYRERLRDYRKPVGEVAVLLPCSARKPYSRSRSHRLFRMVTDRFRGLVHEVIVTSPLGIVPRELENFYPPANYDISVTGEWSGEEQEMVIEMLKNVVPQYSAVINHTPYDFLREAFPDIEMRSTVLDGRPTSRESLSALESALKARAGISSANPSDWKRAVFRNMWEFQFGGGTGKAIEGFKVSGKFPFFKLFDGKAQIAMFVPERHRISLTLRGGGVLSKLGQNRVFIGDFMPSGDIFAVGIEDADPDIHVGDEVVILHENEVRGVGVARMCGEEMAELRRGVAVKVRHRKRE